MSRRRFGLRGKAKEGPVNAYQTRATRVALLAASSLSAMILASPGAAQSVQGANFAINSPSIVINNNFSPTTPPPTGDLDTANVLMPNGSRSSGLTIGAATGVNGVGQMTLAEDPNSTALLLCTGTL